MLVLIEGWDMASSYTGHDLESSQKGWKRSYFLICGSDPIFVDHLGGMEVLSVGSEDGFGTAVIDVESLGCLSKKKGTSLMDLLFRMIKERNSLRNSSLTLEYFLEFLWGEGMDI